MRNEKEYNLIRLGQSFNRPIEYDLFAKLIKIRNAIQKLHRLCEDYCIKEGFNPELIDKQEATIKRLVAELPKELNLNIENIQHDPRGWEVGFNNRWFDHFVYL